MASAPTHPTSTTRSCGARRSSRSSAGAGGTTTGPMAPLHKLNPVRRRLHPRSSLRHFGRDPPRPSRWRALRALDIGCGGGLLAEPLARLGAAVTGIDPLDGNAETAAWPRRRGRAWRSTTGASTVEAVAAAGRRFDLVVASEVVEHVPDVPAVPRRHRWPVTAAGRAGDPIDPEPHPASFLKAIVGAEYVLGWLPRGTHDWRRFLTPAELGRVLQGAAAFRPLARPAGSAMTARATVPAEPRPERQLPAGSRARAEAVSRPAREDPAAAAPRCPRRAAPCASSSVARP